MNNNSQIYFFLTPGLARIITIILLGITTNVFADSSRKYDPALLEHGKNLFQKNCAVCHGINAEGTVKDWHIADENGKYPPPPLNGTAHTWHHPINDLFYTIRNGTMEIGGSMPAWKDKLNDEEVFSIIVWLTSLWPDEIYHTWMQLNKKN